VINYNGDPHRVRQHSYSAGDSVPTKQSGWRNHLRPDLDAIERVLKARPRRSRPRSVWQSSGQLTATLDFSADSETFRSSSRPRRLRWPQLTSVTSHHSACC
jgi:hypothetical protein